MRASPPGDRCRDKAPYRRRTRLRPSAGCRAQTAGQCRTPGSSHTSRAMPESPGPAARRRWPARYSSPAAPGSVTPPPSASSDPVSHPSPAPPARCAAGPGARPVPAAPGGASRSGGPTPSWVCRFCQSRSCPAPPPDVLLQQTPGSSCGTGSSRPGCRAGTARSTARHVGPRRGSACAAPTVPAGRPSSAAPRGNRAGPGSGCPGS